MNLFTKTIKPSYFTKTGRLFTASSKEIVVLVKRSIHVNQPKAISINNYLSNKESDANRFDDASEKPYQISESKMKQYKLEEGKYNGKLVYVGGLTSQLKFAKALSLSSSFFGIALLPFLTDTLSASGLFAKIFVFGTSGFFIFVTPLFSQFLGRRYVSRLFYNYEEKRFTAILLSFFMREYKLEFKLEDVFVPDMPGPFTTVELKASKRGLFIDLNQIDDLELTKKIYGFDKPIDFERFNRKN
jgi:transmembrane protein 70